MYLGRAGRTITLTTEPTHFRLHDQARSMRSAFVLYFLETYKRILLPELASDGALWCASV